MMHYWHFYFHLQGFSFSKAHIHISLNKNQKRILLQLKNQNLLKLPLNNHQIILNKNHKIILLIDLKMNLYLLKIQNNNNQKITKKLLKNVLLQKIFNHLILSKKFSKRRIQSINLLSTIQTNPMILLRFKKRKEKIDQPIIKPQIIQQPQPAIIQQPQPVIVQQIDLQYNGEDESEIKNYMVKIRKFIQFFSKEESIFHIIGSTEFQQRQFISRLYLKNLEELKLIHKSIEFELLFSRSNSFVQDSIESGALFIERLLLTIDINVVGVYQEVQKDEEFQFYMNMYLCESSYVASDKQILFLKFIKNYYKKYSENKSNTSIDFKQRLKEQANKELLEKFNRL